MNSLEMGPETHLLDIGYWKDPDMGDRCGNGDNTNTSYTELETKVHNH